MFIYCLSKYIKRDLYIYNKNISNNPVPPPVPYPVGPSMR